MKRMPTLLAFLLVASLSSTHASASVECFEHAQQAVLPVLPGPGPAAPRDMPEPTMKKEQDCPPVEEGRDEEGGLSTIPGEARWALGGLAAIGLAGVGFGLRSLWWPPLRLAAGPFFARLTRRDVTDHPLRARILAAVAQRPGISAVELAAQEKLNVGTLDYHLDVLERDGQLRAAKAGRNRLLFLPGAGVDVQRVAQVSAPGRGDVARAILQEPGLHASALAERLGLSRATVHHHITRLETSGLIRVERGLRARCYPTDELPQALEPVRRRRLAVLADPGRRGADLAT